MKELLFEAFYDAAAIYRENRDLIRKNGYTETGSAGGVVVSPHFRIMRDAWAAMAELSAALVLDE